MTLTFDKLRKQASTERLRNNLIAFFTLCIFSGFFIILSTITKGVVSDILSDFLVNMSAGFCSAAVLFALIEHIFSERQKEKDSNNALVWEIQKYKIMLDQSMAYDDEVIKKLGQCSKLFSRSKGKKPEAQLLYLQQIETLSKEAVEKNAVSKGYRDISLATMRHLWDEYYVDLETSDPEIAHIIKINLEFVLGRVSQYEKREETVNTFIENAQRRVEKIRQEVAANNKPGSL